MAFHYIIPALITAQLTRTCPRCGAKKVARATELGAAIPCPKCGASIPPPAKRG